MPSGPKHRRARAALPGSQPKSYTHIHAVNSDRLASEMNLRSNSYDDDMSSKIGTTYAKAPNPRLTCIDVTAGSALAARRRWQQLALIRQVADEPRKRVE